MRKGWSETTLGDLCDVRDGTHDSPKQSDIGHPLVTSKNIRDGKVDLSDVYLISDSDFHEINKRSKVDQFDLLVSMIGTVGEVCFEPNQPSYAIKNVGLIKTGNELLGRFLLGYLSSRMGQEQIELSTSGSTQKFIGLGKLRSLRVLLPPLEDQKRIVDVVLSVDAYIDALQQQADAARTARNAVLHELLSAGSDDRTETTLGDIAEASWGNTTVTKKQYKESGFTAFSASGPDGYVDWFEHDEKGVVLSAIGALCGKTWLADGKWTPIKNTIWFKSKSQECLTEYLFLVSKTPNLWPIRGQAQPFISLGDVRLVEVSLPPLLEQKRIVELVTSMDDVIQTTEQAVADTKNLRSGLLSDLLSGEHEIPASYDVFLGAA